MQEILKKLGYDMEDAGQREHIQNWLSWYSGKVDSFHNYSQYNGKKKVRRQRATLSMAKRVCEDWANLLLNEKVEITTSHDALTARAKEILAQNHFRVGANRLVELAFALGTGAFVEFLDKGQVKIDYIRADAIYPLSWEGGVVTECAFASQKVFYGKSCIYLQIHVLEDGEYVIKNRLFDEKTKKEMPLPDGLVPEFKTGSVAPFFQLITPNTVSNASPASPMGAAVFANAIDVLKGIDLVYDSFQNEFRLGKKRIVVPVGMAQLESEKTGFMPVFDDNDTEFYAFADKNLTDLKEIDMTIRAMEHTEGLAQNLNLLSDLCGLGSSRYVQKDGVVKTATEVISQDSALYQNLKKHAILLENAICDLVRAVLYLDGADVKNLAVFVAFDDSIIHDTNSEFNQNVRLVELGILAPFEFRMWWKNESESQAKTAILACKSA